MASEGFVRKQNKKVKSRWYLNERAMEQKTYFGNRDQKSGNKWIAECSVQSQDGSESQEDGIRDVDVFV